MLTRVAHLSIGLVSLIAFVASAAAAEPVRLRVLSYNIHHGRGGDGIIDLARIATTINSARVDLAALQEVDRRTTRSGKQDQLLQLAELTGLHHVFGKAIDYGGGDYGVAVLSRYTISNSHTFRLPSSNDREQRVALEVKVQVPEFSPLIFVNTHLDHHREDRDRMAQAGELLELFSHGPRAAIIAGDLNATPGSKVIRVLQQHWQLADAERLRFTAPADNPRAKIDYILYPNDSPWQVVSTRVLDDRTSSDHLAILVEFASRSRP